MFVHLCFHLFHHCAVRAIGTLQRDDSCQRAWPSRIKSTHVSLVSFVSSVRMFLDCFDFCCLLWFCCLTFFSLVTPFEITHLSEHIGCLLISNCVFKEESKEEREKESQKSEGRVSPLAPEPWEGLWFMPVFLSEQLLQFIYLILSLFSEFFPSQL